MQFLICYTPENHYLDMLYQDIDFVISQLSIERQFYYVSLLKEL